MIEFKKIINHPYMVSNDGTVVSLGRVIIRNDGKRLTIPERIMKDRIMPNGYVKVDMVSNDGERKTYSVHRLVAKYFIQNPYNHPQVNHIDGNKRNNKVENLEWISARDNIRHARLTGLQKTKYGSETSSNKIQEKDVLEIFSLRKMNVSVKEIADKFSMSPQNIYDIINRKIWSHVEIPCDFMPAVGKYG